MIRRLGEILLNLDLPLIRNPEKLNKQLDGLPGLPCWQGLPLLPRNVRAGTSGFGA